MAEDNYARTEPASERRLAQARAGGDVPRSPDLTVFLVLVALLAGLIWWGGQLFAGLQAMLSTHMARAAQFSPDVLVELLLQAGGMLMPFLLAGFLAMLIAPLLLSGWVFSPQALHFQSKRLSPLARVKRLFSMDGLFHAGKALLVWLIVGSVLIAIFQSQLHKLALLPAMALRDALSLSFEWLVASAGWLLLAFFLAAVLDVPWRWWRYLKSHAMTRGEVLDEAREAEGHPALKARILARRQQAQTGGGRQ